MKRKFIFLFLCLLLAFGLGCARTVTTSSDIVEGEFEIDFAGPVDTTLYNYYLIFSYATVPAVPAFPPPDEYFPTPGRPFDRGSQYIVTHGGFSYYPNTFFKTWSDYIICTNKSVIFYPSKTAASPNATAFDANLTATNNVSQYPPAVNFGVNFAVVNNPSISGGQGIVVRFALQNLSSFVPGALLNFMFVTSRRDTGGDNTGTGIVVDRLVLISPSVSTSPGTDTGYQPDDATKPSADPGANITQWRVRIF